MKTITTLFSFFILAVVSVGATAQAADAVPSLINYSGTLASSGGQAVTGTKSITFKYYDHATAGNTLWTETQNVSVANGRFNVLLGSVTPITAVVFENRSAVYLGIKVGSDSEMTPRQRVASVPYAMVASGNANGGELKLYDGNGVVRGTVVSISPNQSSTGLGWKTRVLLPAGIVATYKTNVAPYYSLDDVEAPPGPIYSYTNGYVLDYTGPSCTGQTYISSGSPFALGDAMPASADDYFFLPVTATNTASVSISSERPIGASSCTNFAPSVRNNVTRVQLVAPGEVEFVRPLVVKP